MSAEQWMQMAITKAQEGIAGGQSPFGAVIVHNQTVVAVAHNTVWRTLDPTAHAEVNAIRLAAQQLQTIHLTGLELYSTCEPCPMCLTACHWAKLAAVYYGATIADAAAAGFAELEVPAIQLAQMGRSPLRVATGPLAAACVALFQQWRDAGLAQYY